MRSPVVRAALHALLAALGGVVCALFTLRIDRAANLHLPVPADNARVVVAGIVSALITVALFSLWMRSIVAGLASGQISAQIVAGYLDDDVQWRLITAMSAAITYTLTVLLHLPADAADEVPASSIILTVCLVILGLVAVMGALRSAVKGLSPAQVLASLAAQARTAIRDDPAPNDPWPDDASEGDPEPEAATIIASDHLGWVHAIDHTTILDVLPAQARLGLHVDTGSFVTSGDHLASCDTGLPAEDIDTIRDAIVLTDMRRPDGDLGLYLQQLRDLAQRALGSEGDSSLSEEALLHLRAILTQLIETGVRTGHAVGPDDRVIVAIERRTVCDHLWDTLEPLVYASQQGSPIGRRWVATTIHQLRRRTTSDDDAHAVLDHLLSLLEADAQPRTAAFEHASSHGAEA